MISAILFADLPAIMLTTEGVVGTLAVIVPAIAGGLWKAANLLIGYQEKKDAKHEEERKERDKLFASTLTSVATTFDATRKEDSVRCHENQQLIVKLLQERAPNIVMQGAIKQGDSTNA